MESCLDEFDFKFIDLIHQLSICTHAKLLRTIDLLVIGRYRFDCRFNREDLIND